MEQQPFRCSPHRHVWATWAQGYKLMPDVTLNGVKCQCGHFIAVSKACSACSRDHLKVVRLNSDEMAGGE